MAFGGCLNIQGKVGKGGLIYSAGASIIHHDSGGRLDPCELWVAPLYLVLRQCHVGTPLMAFLLQRLQIMMKLLHIRFCDVSIRITSVCCCLEFRNSK
ncbi:Uncharacterized protein HZ326_3915 [Fusarium oxysporum f. sp. albedinis]|nr:Uncharacterized protein HZ326_3915 [Fusarium oxysporum f. sp. albedinis]